MAGVELRPYQREAIDAIKAADSWGIRRQLVVCPTGGGKAQPEDEPVLTPSGWRPIGTLRPGDRVTRPGGDTALVAAVYPQGEALAWRLLATDGGWARCDGGHLWATTDGAGGDGRTDTLADLLAGAVGPPGGRMLPATRAPGAPPGPRRLIGAVPDGRARMVCIALDTPDGLYVTRSGLATHNTVIFTSLLAELGGPALILAHRRELLDQAAKVANRLEGDGLRARLLRSDASGALGPGEVGVASIQRLGARPGLVAALRASGLRAVIVDEAHHSLAESWRAVLRDLGIGQGDRPLLVGVTATPRRGDGRPLGRLYQKVVFERSVTDLMDEGYLCPARGLSIRIDADLKGTLGDFGDFDPAAVGRAMSLARAPEHLAQAYVEHGEGRPTIAFTPTVAVGRELAQALQRLDVVAAVVSGADPAGRRRQILAAFDAGTIRVLINSSLLTEGYDSPRISCVMMCRPTTSQGLYMQCLGRGLRLSPATGKTDCLVMDVVGAHAEVDVCELADIFEEPAPKAGRPRPEPGDETGDGPGASRETGGDFPLEMAAADLLARVGTVSERVDLFRQVSRLHLLEIPDAPARTRVAAVERDGRRGMVRVAEPRPGRWAVAIDWEGREREILARDMEEGPAMLLAADVAWRIGPAGLLATGAAWRLRPAGEAALGLARRLGVRVSDGATAGAVSDAITVRRAMGSER